MPNEVNADNEITNYAAAKVRAKFFVQTRTEHAHAPGGVQVTLSAVSRGADNAEWAQYTPSGNLTMAIKAGPAADFFTLGREVYLDFLPVD